MTAINPNDLSKFKGILEVRPAGSTGAFTRLASVRGLVANLDNSNVIEVLADDTGTVYKVSNVQATIEAELLESMGRDTIDLLFTGTASNVAGSLVSGATQTILSGTKAYNEFTKIDNQNGDGSAISITSVVGATDGALVANTDYVLVKNDDGDYGIAIIDSTTVTTMAQNFVITYAYTPNASENISITLDSTELKNFEIKITATSGTDTRTTTVSSASFEGVYGMSYVDVVEAGDITGAQLTFSSNKGALLTYENSIL